MLGITLENPEEHGGSLLQLGGGQHKETEGPNPTLHLSTLDLAQALGISAP